MVRMIIKIMPAIYTHIRIMLQSGVDASVMEVEAIASIDVFSVGEEGVHIDFTILITGIDRNDIA